MSRYVPCSIDPQCWTGGAGGTGGTGGTGGDGGDEEMVWSQDGSLQREVVIECPECSVCPLQGEKCSVRSEAGLTSSLQARSLPVHH